MSSESGQVAIQKYEPRRRRSLLFRSSGQAFQPSLRLEFQHGGAFIERADGVSTTLPFTFLGDDVEITAHGYASFSRDIAIIATADGISGLQVVSLVANRRWPMRRTATRGPPHIKRTASIQVSMQALLAELPDDGGTQPTFQRKRVLATRRARS